MYSFGQRKMSDIAEINLKIATCNTPILTKPTTHNQLKLYLGQILN